MTNIAIADRLRLTLVDLFEKGEKIGGERQSVESICLTILALRHKGRTSTLDSALHTLGTSQNSDGSWPAFVGDEPQGCWATGLAVVTLLGTGRCKERLKAASHWLLQAKGREANWFWRWRFKTIDTNVKFDPTKYGWSWVPGTTSWVIPTAFGVIALRQMRTHVLSEGPEIDERIDRGFGMLLDRMCPGGGWNAGNGVAFSVPYAPYIDATSIALLALQGYEHEGVNLSFSWLVARLPACPSPYSLGWGILALVAYAGKVHDFSDALPRTRDALLVRLEKNRGALDTSTLAICALALDAVESDNVFEVRR
jgi:hypothetical protein